jgi:hypothetical protein
MASNSPKHTPGPWIYHPHPIMGAVDNQRVTVSEAPNARGEQIQIGDIFSKQNASLIAAAPDLLAACKLFFSWLENGTLVRDITRDAQSDWALRMMEFARDLGKVQLAISQAESE